MKVRRSGARPACYTFRITIMFSARNKFTHGSHDRGAWPWRRCALPA